MDCDYEIILYIAIFSAIIIPMCFFSILSYEPSDILGSISKYVCMFIVFISILFCLPSALFIFLYYKLHSFYQKRKNKPLTSVKTTHPHKSNSSGSSLPRTSFPSPVPIPGHQEIAQPKQNDALTQNDTMLPLPTLQQQSAVQSPAYRVSAFIWDLAYKSAKELQGPLLKNAVFFWVAFFYPINKRLIDPLAGQSIYAEFLPSLAAKLYLTSLDQEIVSTVQQAYLDFAKALNASRISPDLPGGWDALWHLTGRWVNAPLTSLNNSNLFIYRSVSCCLFAERFFELRPLRYPTKPSSTPKIHLQYDDDSIIK